MWKEQHLYGSSRLGMWQPEKVLSGVVLPMLGVCGDGQGVRLYELMYHLGNVLATINDKGKVVSAQDYFPFGLKLDGRHFNTEGYRFGFNGKEYEGTFKSQDYGMRIYRPDLGRFLSVDPIGRKYPELTPYQFASNTPIIAVDIDGLEAEWVNQTIWTEREKAKKEGGEAAAQQFDAGVSAGALPTVVLLVDVFITKGWLSRTLGTGTLLNAISNDHAASNIKDNTTAKAKLANEASEGYKSAAIGYLFGKALGAAGKALTKSKVAGQVKNWTKITEERLDDIDEDMVMLNNTAYNLHLKQGGNTVRVGSSYMDEHGILNFEIAVPSNLQKQGIAGEVFKKAITANNPVAVRGTWLAGDVENSTNFSTYRRLVDVEHIAPEKAVFMTPTGKLAAKNGFDGTPHINMDNQSGVQVVFNKPN